MKYALIIALIALASCAYVAGNGNATVAIDRRLDIDSTIATPINQPASAPYRVPNQPASAPYK